MTSPPPTLNEGRSLNPGDTAFRAVPGRPDVGALNEGRSLNPGDTSRTADRSAQALSALNEGRSLNPGDTRKNALIFEDGIHRSTKAGV